MDMLENDINIEQPKVTEETVNYDAQNMSSNWHLTPNKNTSIGMGNNPMVEPSSCMVDSFCPQIFDQPIHGTNWYPNVVFPSSVPRMVPTSLPHFPSESSFIERAVRFSCFDGGHFSQMANPFGNFDPLDHNSHQGLMRNPNEAFVGNELKASVREVFEETKNGVDSLGTTLSDGAEFSGRGNEAEFEGTGGEFSGKGIGLKKRKRNEQKTVNNENNEAEQPADESGPGGKGPSPDKEEYIHVRARRGQATNSHSLAERIRREKISERMKFLQDLVPGCSKVTGKAVMLDEIINYVQSLQRQVEFLSMKLATVNPRLDFNIEGYLAKDILQTRAGLSASLGFPPDMTMHFPHNIHPSLPAGVIQSTLHGETLHRPICYQTNVVSRGFREPTSQAPCVWDDELHNVINNGFNLSAPPNSSDLSGRMKAEP